MRGARGARGQRVARQAYEEREACAGLEDLPGDLSVFQVHPLSPPPAPRACAVRVCSLRDASACAREMLVIWLLSACALIASLCVSLGAHFLVGRGDEDAYDFGGGDAYFVNVVL